MVTFSFLVLIESSYNDPVKFPEYFDNSAYFPFVIASSDHDIISVEYFPAGEVHLEGFILVFARKGVGPFCFVEIAG